MTEEQIRQQVALAMAKELRRQLDEARYPDQGLEWLDTDDLTKVEIDGKGLDLVALAEVAIQSSRTDEHGRVWTAIGTPLITESLRWPDDFPRPRDDEADDD